METEKELKVRGFLLNEGFSSEQAELVIRMIDKACVKLLEDVIAALDKKKLKIQNEQ